MALRLDFGHLEYGYFWTRDFGELREYCMQLMVLKNESFIVAVHSSALFTCEGNTMEMHMPVRPLVVFDPQHDEQFMVEMLDNMGGLLADIENFEGFESSGWNYVPGTMKYWFKVYPCQPNPTPSQNSRNTLDEDDRDEDSQRSPHRRLNPFVSAVIAAYYLKEHGKLPRTITAREAAFEAFAERNLQFILPFLRTPNFRLDYLRRWHEFTLMRLNVRVWSMRGNLLYAKRMGPPDEEWIDLYLNSKNNFALVRSLTAFFGKHSSKVMCDDCHTFHNQNGACKLAISACTDEDLNLPDLPQGRHGCVCYCDFESIITPEKEHKTSGYCVFAISKSGRVLFNETRCVLDLESETIQQDFMKAIFKSADAFARRNYPFTPDAICKICGETLLGDCILGRNFVNGEWGNHHTTCWNDARNCMYCFFHNFRGYDSHFLMEEICKNYNVDFMQATSMEKFNLIRITRKNDPLIAITFKDTYNFFTCSLAACVKMVEDWRYVEPEYRNDKGIFPYEWFDSFEKLSNEGLPPGPWMNTLGNQEIDSAPAERVWQNERFKFFFEYHDFYCRLDTMQLADTFEEFRRTCVAEFNVDPVHFMGAPSLTWYLGLKNNIEMFKIIPDAKVYLDIQSQIRGGVTQAMIRYHKTTPDNTILFLDVNSLYSKCMTYKMPGKYLRRIEGAPEGWETNYTPEDNKTLFLVCDLEYPAHLHDRDYAYPLAPHKFNDRLCTTFLPRQNYMVHVEVLKFYLERGLVLSKVHYCYEFEQDFALKNYVENNINKRRATRSDVMKTLYKLLNNSLYGKTCENVFKYRSFSVQEQEELPDGRVNAFLANTKNHVAFDDVFLVENEISEVKLNKPIQIGFTVLEFAKREIYRFLAAVQDSFGDDVVPMYTDTDSIMFKCKFNRPWEKFFNAPLVRPLLDFDAVPEHWGVRTPGTKKESGLWSPEADGKEIVEYVGLRAKCYAYRFADDSVVLKNKGVPKASTLVDGARITFEDYKQALFEGKDKEITHYVIRSEKHQVTTKQVTKLGISGNDLKRTILANPTISLPFGYRGEQFDSNDADDDAEQWQPAE